MAFWGPFTLAGRVQTVAMIGSMPKQLGLSHDIVNAALAGLEAEKKKLDAHIAQVQALLGTAPKRRGRPPKNVLQMPVAEPATGEAATRRKRRKMGTAARRRLSDSMKKRWAAAKRAGRTTL